MTEKRLKEIKDSIDFQEKVMAAYGQDMLLVTEEEELYREVIRLNRLKKNIAEEILQELEENNHLSYGVALSIRQKLLDYREINEEDEKMAKRKNKDLVWYAFYQDFNSSKLVYTNVLGRSFAEEVLKRVKSKQEYWKIDSYETLKKAVEGELKYHYRSKSEYEVIVSNWSGRDMEEKIDIWYQLEPNLDRICEYIMRELQLEF